MRNRISPQTPFLGFFGWLGIVGVAVAILGMGLSKTEHLNLLTEKIFERKSVVLLNLNEMDWTNKPQGYTVTQNKGTLLRVRSYIHEVVGEKPLTAKAISF